MKLIVLQNAVTSAIRTIINTDNVFSVSKGDDVVKNYDIIFSGIKDYYANIKNVAKKEVDYILNVITAFLSGSALSTIDTTSFTKVADYEAAEALLPTASANDLIGIDEGGKLYKVTEVAGDVYAEKTAMALNKIYGFVAVNEELSIQNSFYLCVNYQSSNITTFARCGMNKTSSNLYPTKESIPETELRDNHSYCITGDNKIYKYTNGNFVDVTSTQDISEVFINESRTAISIYDKTTHLIEDISSLLSDVVLQKAFKIQTGEESYTETTWIYEQNSEGQTLDIVKNGDNQGNSPQIFDTKYINKHLMPALGLNGYIYIFKQSTIKRLLPQTPSEDIFYKYSNKIYFNEDDKWLEQSPLVDKGYTTDSSSAKYNANVLYLNIE